METCLSVQGHNASCDQGFYLFSNSYKMICLIDGSQSLKGVGKMSQTHNGSMSLRPVFCVWL